MTALLGAALSVALPLEAGASVSVLARGASKVTGEFDFVEQGDRISIRGQLRGLAPGTYHVLLVSECPRDPRPRDLRTGEVPVDRRTGDEEEPLPTPFMQVGTFIADDRTSRTFEAPLPPRTLDRWARFGIALREGDDVNPSLSDRFGLVACTPVALPR